MILGKQSRSEELVQVKENETTSQLAIKIEVRRITTEREPHTCSRITSRKERQCGEKQRRAERNKENSIQLKNLRIDGKRSPQACT